MRYFTTIVATIFATSAGAQGVDACREAPYSSERWNAAICSVTNSTDQSIARIIYSAVVYDPSREVPWDAREGPRRIRGGIEPGETVDLSFIVSGGLPERADADNVRVDLEITEAQNIDGDVIYTNQ